MSLLAKLKSILGLHGETENAQDVGVTVERDPSDERSDTRTVTAGAAEPDDAGAGSGGATGSAAAAGTQLESSRSRASADESTDTTAEEPANSSRTRAQADTTDVPATEDTAESTTAETETVSDGTPVTEIKGIGDAYADRLEAAGVDCVEELADADAASLAGETDIAEGRLEGWIEKARAHT
jgi:predicted flap endonuclease-1-like 5' DNA nuclease